MKLWIELLLKSFIFDWLANASIFLWTKATLTYTPTSINTTLDYNNTTVLNHFFLYYLKILTLIHYLKYYFQITSFLQVMQRRSSLTFKRIFFWTFYKDARAGRVNLPEKMQLFETHSLSFTATVCSIRQYTLQTKYILQKPAVGLYMTH